MSQRKVKFLRQPPFYLPSKSAVASSSDETVHLTLHVISLDHESKLVPIQVAMTWRNAQKLADQLREAALNCMRMESNGHCGLNLVAKGKSVAVLAVDPTSTRSGGVR
jgi:hypothetical protein